MRRDIGRMAELIEGVLSGAFGGVGFEIVPK